MTKLMLLMRASLVIAMATSMPTLGWGQATSKKDSLRLSSGMDLVAKVEALQAHAGGIIVGATSDTVYIATVRHVLRRARVHQGDSTSVFVTFRFIHPSRRVPARVSRVHSGDDESTSDVALLAVSTHHVPEFGSYRLQFDRRTRVRLGEAVVSIGCPGAICWEIPTDERVLAVATEISFLSHFMETGKSGGVLLNQWGEIAGMLLREEQGLPLGRAVTIDKLLAEVSAWDVPVALKTPVVPRRGYDLVARGVVLQSEESSNPGGRGAFEGSLTRTFRWHIAGARLTAPRLTITSGTVGIGVVGRVGRIAFTPYAEAGVARAESWFDAGGFTVTDPGGEDRYIPDWTPTEGFGFGAGGGLNADLAIIPRVMLNASVGTWTYQRPVNSAPIPKLFYGAGLAWAVK